MLDETTGNMTDALGMSGDALDRAADREQIAKAVAERDRRIRLRAKQAVDEWIKQVLPGYVAVDLHGQLAGAPEGILMGWCMELGTLMNRLEDVRQRLSDDAADESTLIKGARKEVLATLYRIRPDIGLLRWFDLAARTGVMAELGQYAAATRRLAQELMRLYHECQPDLGGPTGPLMLPY
jgi:hypothetical protein